MCWKYETMYYICKTIINNMEQILTQCRVCNLVEIYNRTSGEWEVYRITHRDFPELKYRSELFRGIPLTEEWLLKFAFVNEPYTKKMFEYPPLNMYKQFKNHCLTITLKEGIVCIVEVGVQQTEEKYVQFVHQLQNLYHALAGEELIVK